MSQIVNNRICFPTHNIVLDPSVHEARPDYIMDVEAALTPEGDARLHRAQLDSFTGIHCFAVEKPTLTITPFHENEKAELRCEIPTKMLATVTLNNGNFDKVICAVHCYCSESFYPLYGAMSQHGIDVGPKARREAETEYFKLYDSYVAANS